MCELAIVTCIGLSTLSKRCFSQKRINIQLIFFNICLDRIFTADIQLAVCWQQQFVFLLALQSYSAAKETTAANYEYSLHFYSVSSSRASIRKLTGRKPSLHEIMAECGFFIHPSQKLLPPWASVIMKGDIVSQALRQSPSGRCQPFAMNACPSCKSHAWSMWFSYRSIRSLWQTFQMTVIFTFFIFLCSHKLILFAIWHITIFPIRISILYALIIIPCYIPPIKFSICLFYIQYFDTDIIKNILITIICISQWSFIV